MTCVSACLIVRDEEANIDACLETLQPFVDEVVVVDTGSTDRTVELARAHGARVFETAWQEDFALARNHALDQARGDWILSVDADELLDPEGAAGLRELVEGADAMAFLVWIDNLDGGRDSQGRPSYSSIAVPRLFRRVPELRWERPLHETITGGLERLRCGALEPSGLRLVHHGYLPEVVRERGKRERNQRILEAHVERTPGDHYARYKLAVTKVTLGASEEALEQLEALRLQATELASGPRSRLDFLPLAAAEEARLLRQQGRLGEAARLCGEGLDEWEGVGELHFEAAEVERASGELEAATEHYAAALESRPWSELHPGRPEARGWAAWLGLARVALLAGDPALALDHAGRALALAPNSDEAQALAVRLRAVAGEEGQAWSDLSRLLESSPGSEHARTLAAEMAWSRGEVETACALWDTLRGSSEPASLAACWRVLAALGRGDLEVAREELVTLRPRDLPEAGILKLASEELGQPLRVDPRIRPEALEGEVAAWRLELERARPQAQG